MWWMGEAEGREKGWGQGVGGYISPLLNIKITISL